MSKELVISANRHETKVALLEDDQLVEIYFQRANEYSLAGSIHKGRVTRVLPGMQSAFVDLGLERDTFLYVSDFFEENEEYDKIAGPADDRQSRSPRRDDRGRGENRPEAAREGGREPREASRQEQAKDFTRVDVARPLPTGFERELPKPPANGADAPVESAAPPRQTSSPAVRTQEGDGRDRNGGRRSRRRRTRGRGFPESKYASDLDTRASVSDGEQESSADEIADDAQEVILLPGESLAKYRSYADRPHEPADDVADEPVLSLHEEIAASEVEDEDPQGITAGDLEDSQPSAYMPAEDPVSLSSAGGAAVALAHEDAEPAGLQEPEVTSTTETAQLEEDRFESGKDTEAVAEESAAGSSFPESAFFTPQIPLAEPDVEVEGLPAETDEGNEEVDFMDAEGGLDLVSSDALSDVAPEADTPDLDAPEVAAEGGPALASVREQGGRYQHRVSRRSRRRQRGGSEPRAEGELAVVQSEARPAAREEAPPAPRETDRDREREKPVTPSISELLHEGQEIIVQIAKEPLGQKGARITSHIALPGRYVVYMPTLEHLGVSRKIASDEERQRLKRILQGHRTGITGGYIVRTAGEGHTEEEIAADMAFLYNLWLDIRQKAEKKKAPALLHHDLEIVQRILRDQLTESFKAVWVDNEDLYESVLRFMQRFQPALVSRIKMYTRPEPIFEKFGVSAEIEKALKPKVWLKSGGYIVINQTEALVAVDVNTGKYVGKSNRLEDTITKTNTEAVKEIVRQIRLRDLGGIIVVDFIDMDERKNRQKVMQALEEAMQADRAPYKILQFNDFGLVAITRKRVKQSLERSLCSPCPACEGAGYVKSVSTIVSEILLEATKLGGTLEGKNVVLRTHPDVAKFLKSNTNKYLEELEQILGRPILVSGDPALHPEKFDLG